MPNLGSAELNLLAAAPARFAPADADKPLFYDARIRAAQNSSDAAQKLRLLANAISDTPVRDDARVPLFYAAISQHQDEFALAAIANLLPAQLIPQNSRRASASDEDESDPSADAEPSPDQPAVPAQESTQLTPQQRAQFAYATAQAMIRLGRLSDAQPYLQSALRLETTPARRKEISLALIDARSRQRRIQENLARQPILHAELEQDHIVRPRRIARTAARKTATPAPGGTP